MRMTASVLRRQLVGCLEESAELFVCTAKKHGLLDRDAVQVRWNGAGAEILQMARDETKAVVMDGASCCEGADEDSRNQKGVGATITGGVDWASDPLGIGNSLPRIMQSPEGSTSSRDAGDDAGGDSLWLRLDKDGRLPLGLLPSVWVGSDRFGRSKGLALISARSAEEATVLIQLLDGTRLFGRTLEAKLDDSVAQAQQIGLPQFRPMWLTRLRGDSSAPAPTATTDTTGAAW